MKLGFCSMCVCYDHEYGSCSNELAVDAMERKRKLPKFSLGCSEPCPLFEARSKMEK